MIALQYLDIELHYKVKYKIHFVFVVHGVLFSFYGQLVYWWIMVSYRAQLLQSMGAACAGPDTMVVDIPISCQVQQ